MNNTEAQDSCVTYGPLNKAVGYIVRQISVIFSVNLDWWYKQNILNVLIAEDLFLKNAMDAILVLLGILRNSIWHPR